MNLSIPPELLNHAILESGQHCQNYRQIAHRLRELLPHRLKQIQSRYRAQNLKPGASLRAALKDKEYINYLTELNTAEFRANSARIQWETHQMLLNSRRSLRGLTSAH